MCIEWIYSTHLVPELASNSSSGRSAASTSRQRQTRPPSWLPSRTSRWFQGVFSILSKPAHRRKIARKRRRKRKPAPWSGLGQARSAVQKHGLSPRNADSKGLRTRAGPEAQIRQARAPSSLVPGCMLVCLPWQIGVSRNPAKHPAGKNQERHCRKSILHRALARETTPRITRRAAASIFSAIKSNVLPSL